MFLTPNEIGMSYCVFKSINRQPLHDCQASLAQTIPSMEFHNHSCRVFRKISAAADATTSLLNTRLVLPTLPNRNPKCEDINGFAVGKTKHENRHVPHRPVTVCSFRIFPPEWNQPARHLSCIFSTSIWAVLSSNHAMTALFSFYHSKWFAMWNHTTNAMIS